MTRPPTGTSPPSAGSSKASLIILAAFVVAGIGQCACPTRGQRTKDACGSNLTPVTIGGTLTIGCRR